MRSPVLMLCGPAGSGKDTIAGFLVRGHRAVAIAQADPMKRLAAELFGFHESALWGPSEYRNDRTRVVPGMGDADTDWITNWLRDVLPDDRDLEAARGFLRAWLRDLPTLPTARHVLQTLGTEWGRACARGMWSSYALRVAQTLLAGGCYYARAAGVKWAENAAEDASPDLIVITDGRFRNEILAVRQAGGAVVKIVSPGCGLAGDAAKHVSEAEQNSIPDSWFDAVLVNDRAHGLEALGTAVGAMIRGLQGNPYRWRTESSDADKTKRRRWGVPVTGHGV